MIKFSLVKHADPTLFAQRGRKDEFKITTDYIDRKTILVISNFFSIDDANEKEKRKKEKALANFVNAINSGNTNFWQVFAGTLDKSKYRRLQYRLNIVRKGPKVEIK